MKDVRGVVQEHLSLDVLSETSEGNVEIDVAGIVLNVDKLIVDLLKIKGVTRIDKINGSFVVHKQGASALKSVGFKPTEEHIAEDNHSVSEEDATDNERMETDHEVRRHSPLVRRRRRDTRPRNEPVRQQEKRVPLVQVGFMLVCFFLLVLGLWFF